MVRPCPECGRLNAARTVATGLCWACYQRRRRDLRVPRGPLAVMPDLTGAACAGEDPEDFYADDLRDSRERRAFTARALATCAVCPVIDACREWGIRHEEHGVWGGLLPQHRAKVRRGMRDRQPLRDLA